MTKTEALRFAAAILNDLADKEEEAQENTFEMTLTEKEILAYKAEARELSPTEKEILATYNALASGDERARFSLAVKNAGLPQPWLMENARPPIEDAIWNAVLTYEEKVLFVKHGHEQRAGRTRQTLRKHASAKEGLIELLTNRHSSVGLTALAEIDELDNSFEQIALDYADQMPTKVVIKAQENLIRVRAEKAALAAG